MHDIVFIEYLKSLQQLLEDKQGMLLGQFDLLGEQVLESATVAIFIDEIEVVGGLEHIVVFDDIGVILDVGKNVDLINRALLQLFVLLEFVYGDHLDRVLFLVVVVYRAVDLAVDPRTDGFVENVVLDILDHCSIL